MSTDGHVGEDRGGAAETGGGSRQLPIVDIADDLLSQLHLSRRDAMELRPVFVSCVERFTSVKLRAPVRRVLVVTLAGQVYLCDPADGRITHEASLQARYGQQTAGSAAAAEQSGPCVARIIVSSHRAIEAEGEVRPVMWIHLRLPRHMQDVLVYDGVDRDVTPARERKRRSTRRRHKSRGSFHADPLPPNSYLQNDDGHWCKPYGAFRGAQVAAVEPLIAAIRFPAHDGAPPLCSASPLSQGPRSPLFPYIPYEEDVSRVEESAAERFLRIVTHFAPPPYSAVSYSDFPVHRQIPMFLRNPAKYGLPESLHVDHMYGDVVGDLKTRECRTSADVASKYMRDAVADEVERRVQALQLPRSTGLGDANDSVATECQHLRQWGHSGNPLARSPPGSAWPRQPMPLASAESATWSTIPDGSGDAALPQADAGRPCRDAQADKDGRSQDTSLCHSLLLPSPPRRSGSPISGVNRLRHAVLSQLRKPQKR